LLGWRFPFGLDWFSSGFFLPLLFSFLCHLFKGLPIHVIDVFVLPLELGYGIMYFIYGLLKYSILLLLFLVEPVEVLANLLPCVLNALYYDLVTDG
jgi:hypothetical protein